MIRVVRKPDVCICENKDADQLRGNREADQRLCFRYTDSTISLLPKYEISSLQPSSVAVQPGLCGPGRKPRRPVFSERGSYRPVHTDEPIDLQMVFMAFFIRFGPSYCILPDVYALDTPTPNIQEVEIKQFWPYIYMYTYARRVFLDMQIAL